MAVVAANRTQDTAGTILPIETESNPVTAMDRQVVVVGDPATASKAKVSTLGEVTVATLDTVASASLTAVNQTVAVALQGDSAGAVQVTGTFVATMQIEGTLDGTNWVAINGVAAGQTFPSPLITAPGLYRCTPGGLAQFRVNMTAFTSGTAVVSLRASDATGGTFVTQVLGTRLTDGTTNVGIKPASTAVVAADPAVPVGIHPSSNFVRKATAATTALTSVASSATSVTILATNTNRLGATVLNDSTSTLYLALSSAAASTTAHTVQLTAGAYYELPNDGLGYVGAITGIWSTANGAARVTELSA